MSSTIEEATLTAPDISCAHCVMTIERTLGELPGISRVAVDPGDKLVQVSFDPDRVSLGEIEAALDDAGYPVAKQGA
jgi:copper chaperone